MCRSIINSYNINSSDYRTGCDHKKQMENVKYFKFWVPDNK